MNQMQLFDQMPESDLAILKKAWSILNRYFSETPPVVKTRNTTVHKSTQLCLDEIKSVYGNEWIYKKDDLLFDICLKHRKLSLSNVISKYVELNLIEVVRVNNQTQNIIKFRFL